LPDPAKNESSGLDTFSGGGPYIAVASYTVLLLSPFSANLVSIFKFYIPKYMFLKLRQ
jgi:hypothetical protein